jgi:hypothetical protein
VTEALQRPVGAAYRAVELPLAMVAACATSAAPAMLAEPPLTVVPRPSRGSDPSRHTLSRWPLPSHIRLLAEIEH